jgi:uncharacterized repeat protein (TIGR01451 family)
MKSLLYAVLLGSFCAFFSPLAAQNLLVAYTLPDTLYVCNTDTFTVQIQNTGATSVTGAVLVLTLPTGLNYVPGSITGGATEQSGFAPAFLLPGLSAGAVASFSVRLSADCSAAEVLDAGGDFKVGINLQSIPQPVQILTTEIKVQTGLLIIESVDSQLLTGERCDTLLRRICVKNTRLGPISNLHFEDEHLAGFETLVLDTLHNKPIVCCWRRLILMAVFLRVLATVIPCWNSMK